MKTIFSISLIFSLVYIVTWGANLVKFADCDFNSPYRCELIHGVGVVVPAASLVTVWFKDDSVK